MISVYTVQVNIDIAVQCRVRSRRVVLTLEINLREESRCQDLLLPNQVRSPSLCQLTPSFNSLLACRKFRMMKKLAFRAFGVMFFQGELYQQLCPRVAFIATASWLRTSTKATTYNAIRYDEHQKCCGLPMPCKIRTQTIC